MGATSLDLDKDGRQQPITGLQEAINRRLLRLKA
jgi:hypothetical protein